MKPKILSLPSVDKKYRTDESNSADLVNCQFLPREPKKARESRPKNERNFARVLVCPRIGREIEYSPNKRDRFFSGSSAAETLVSYPLKTPVNNKNGAGGLESISEP